MGKKGGSGVRLPIVGGPQLQFKGMWNFAVSWETPISFQARRSETSREPSYGRRCVVGESGSCMYGCVRSKGTTAVTRWQQNKKKSRRNGCFSCADAEVRERVLQVATLRSTEYSGAY